MHPPGTVLASVASFQRRLCSACQVATVLAILLRGSFAFTYQLTVQVNAGATDCFYQPLPDAGALLEIEYQVIDGDGTDINFSVYAPDGALVIEDIGVGENSHKLTDTQTGDYAVCLANTQSYSSRLVFFEVYSDTHDAGFSSKWSRGPIPTDDPDLDEATKELTRVLERVQAHLERVGGAQALMRAHEAHDRSAQNANYDRVNFFSALQLFVMISVGSMQVLIIRKLFNPSSHRGMKTST